MADDVAVMRTCADAACGHASIRSGGSGESSVILRWHSNIPVIERRPLTTVPYPLRVNSVCSMRFTRSPSIAGDQATVAVEPYATHACSQLDGIEQQK